MKYFILVLTIINLLTAQGIHFSERSTLIKDYGDDRKISDRPHLALPSTQGILVLVDSSGAGPYTAWGNKHECLSFNPILGYLEFVNRGYSPTGDLYVHQTDIVFTFWTHDLAYEATLHGRACYPSSLASENGPHIGFPILDQVTGTWGHMGGQFDAGGWFSGFWDPAVNLSGNVGAWTSIPKELPSGDIVFFADIVDSTIRYETWTTDLSLQQAEGVFGPNVDYWGADCNGGVCYLFYYDLATLDVYYRTTTDGINWSPETLWDITYPTPYANNDLEWTQMALTDAGNPILVFDIEDADDLTYPYDHKTYVQVADGAIPIQLSEDIYDCGWYPTIATGGDWVVVLFLQHTNEEEDSLTRMDLFWCYSNDNGVTWSTPYILTENFPVRPGLPQLAKRLDPANGNFFYFFLTHSVVDLDIMWMVYSCSEHRFEPCALWVGWEPIVGISENAQNPIPQKLRLDVYPNPFRKRTDIRYGITEEVDSPDTEVGMLDLSTKSEFRKNRHSEKIVVSIKIYDATGRVVKTFPHLTHDALRTTHIVWCGDDDFGRKLPAGVYFVRLEDSETSIVEKAIKCE
ncbi:MAG: T9SS type A sorting domain-containing protein [candidate division WOR-3 bacterium]|nr:MAG: T9SS type A sorting domain-containing protein [candidate division WOR-3 bacterium]